MSNDTALALVKRRMKTITEENEKLKTRLKKTKCVLKRLIYLADKARLHVSDGNDFKAELFLELQEAKSLIRDMGDTV